MKLLLNSVIEISILALESRWFLSFGKNALTLGRLFLHAQMDKMHQLTQLFFK